MQNETKIKLIEFFRNNQEIFKSVRDDWYLTRCPLCGDTKKNLSEGHFYMKINPNDNYAIGFNCFRCGEHGILTDEILELFGASTELKQNIIHLNNVSKKIDKKTIIDNNKLLYFNYYAPEVKIGDKTKYIDNRLGIKFTSNDYKDMKVITSIYDFINVNKLKTSSFTNSQLNILENDYVGFLTNGNSHILFRDITDKHSEAWIKYPISKKTMENKVFYSLRGNLDIFTKDDIEINLSEGIMDAIGITYHFNKNHINTMNVAITGKRYEVMIYRLIQLGLIGSNITINIYSDNDWMFGNKKNNFNTTKEFYKKCFDKYKPLFKSINIYYNMKSKDYGVPKSQISIKKEIF